MGFKFQITDAIEIFKDPIGHYHHWTDLIGSVIEGTTRVGDLICIPGVDGAGMCVPVRGFNAFRKDLGSEVSSGQYAGPICVFAGLPSPNKSEIGMGVATDGSHEKFHELILRELHHRRYA
jgi:hypothetical protein